MLYTRRRTTKLMYKNIIFFYYEMYKIVKWRRGTKMAEFTYTQGRNKNLQWNIFSSFCFYETGTEPSQGIESSHLLQVSPLLKEPIIFLLGSYPLSSSENWLRHASRFPVQDHLKAKSPLISTWSSATASLAFSRDIWFVGWVFMA